MSQRAEPGAAAVDTARASHIPLHGTYLDHLALGVQSWADGFPLVCGELGGTWSHGGDAGEYAPCQLTYAADGLKLELISPGSSGDGFMRRFLDRRGPGPHHLTFTVPSLDIALAAMEVLGISPLGVASPAPFFKEAFLHPKNAGVGTLLQLTQVDEAALRGYRAPPPDDFPTDGLEPAAFAWIGLTADSLDAADALFADHLDAEVVESGPGWRLYSWGPQRQLLVRDDSAYPGGDRLWVVSPGVSHLMVGPADLRPTDKVAMEQLRHHPPDPRVGLDIWHAQR